MRLRVLSDLHLEFRGWEPPEVECDVVVLAGDIDVGTRGLPWTRRSFGDRPMIYVPANHEYYEQNWPAFRRQLRAVAKAEDVHLLDGDEVVIGGTRFLGATLGADFELDGSDAQSVAEAMGSANIAMPDDQYRVDVAGRATDTERHAGVTSSPARVVAVAAGGGASPRVRSRSARREPG